MNCSSNEISSYHNADLPTESFRVRDTTIVVTASCKALRFRITTAPNSIALGSTIGLQYVGRPLSRELQDYSPLLDLHQEMPQTNERREGDQSSDSNARIERSETCQLSCR